MLKYDGMSMVEKKVEAVHICNRFLSGQGLLSIQRHNIVEQAIAYKLKKKKNGSHQKFQIIWFLSVFLVLQNKQFFISVPSHIFWPLQKNYETHHSIQYKQTNSCPKTKSKKRFGFCFWVTLFTGITPPNPSLIKSPIMEYLCIYPVYPTEFHKFIYWEESTP